MRRKQGGIALVEILIGLVIFGMILSATLGWQAREASKSTGRLAAENTSSFMQLSAQYFTSNRTAMEKAMQDGTNAADHCKIGVNPDGTGGTTANSLTLHTCAFDASFLRAKGLWPQQMPTTVGASRYVAVFRQIYDTASPPAPTGAVDSLFVLASSSGALAPMTSGNASLLIPELQSARDTMGGMGGFVPAGDMVQCKAERASTTYQACGNGWSVNLAEFISPTQLSIFSAALPN